MANEQKRANRVIEWIGGISLAGLLGAVWFGAQQFQNIDTALNNVAEVGRQTRGYQEAATRAMHALDRQVVTQGAQLDAIAKDVEANRAGIDKIGDRMHFLERRPAPGPQANP